MILRERKLKKCPKCGLHKLVKDAVFGCDNCRKPIDFNKPEKEREYLHMTVFYHDEACDSEELHLCSWACVFEKLKTTKTDSFISLPYLSYDMANPKMGVEGFWEAIRRKKW